MKLFANSLKSSVPIGETKWDPLVKVEEGSLFVYRHSNPQGVQRFMLVDYVFVMSGLITLLPCAYNGLVYIFPLFLFMV